MSDLDALIATTNMTGLINYAREKGAEIERYRALVADLQDSRDGYLEARPEEIDEWDRFRDRAQLLDAMLSAHGFGGAS